MPIQYWILPQHKTAYVKSWGTITAEEILTEGAKLFSDHRWKNGFNVLLDYREITGTNLSSHGIREIVSQDKKHELLFDKSRCAIVANQDILYGLSRMWEMLLVENQIEKMVFRDLNSALNWLGLRPDFLDFF